MHPAVRAIVIPPCPESLLRLQQIVAAPELDSTALEQLASSDVALAAAVMRLANSPLYGLTPTREWTQHGQACMDHLQVTQDELDHRIDALHPAFEAVRF